MRQRKHYILTKTAERDFRDAKAWSLKRWGAELTHQYFKDLHKGQNTLPKTTAHCENAMISPERPVSASILSGNTMSFMRLWTLIKSSLSPWSGKLEMCRAF